jgi:RHS repeat-associated protein
MKRNSSTLRFALFCKYATMLLFVFLTGNAKAATETVLASRAGIAPLQPIQSQLTGFSLWASDQQFSYMLANPTSSGTPWTNRFTIPIIPNSSNYAAYSTVTLRYDESRAKLHTTAWDIEITYTLNTYNATNQLTAYPGEVLTINYDPGTPYTDKVLNRYPNSFRSELRITQVKINSTVITGPIAAQYADVFLDLEQSTERYYNINDIEPVTTSQYIGYSNELEVRWDYVEGAESYDVEWVFVDIDGDPAPALSTSQLPFDFDNATRVNVPDQYYRISMSYPRGVLVYRVRAVGSTAAATELFVTGPWSKMDGQKSGFLDTDANPSNNTNGAYRYDYNGLHSALNWQYSCAYAEDGKRSEQIAIYDGSLRNRQTLGLLNTDNTAIVAETKYDYTGRAALSTIPVPIPSGGVKWYSNFNPNFDRSQWDTDANVENPATLSTANGAGRYYSTANTNAIGVNGQYTPDAQGYAYARMRYLPDGTGRPMSTSAPGPDHRTGSGHEVRYFYGSPSSQAEVDRLFGNEAGNVTHYQKNLVVDANGQVSISYLDQQGRTVATALAGDVPQNLLALDTRPTNSTPITNDLLIGTNQIDYSGQAMVSHKEIMVYAPNTTHTFTYTLGSDTTCSNCFVCKSCVYDLEISVRDIYGDPVQNAAIITSNCPQAATANPLVCNGISSGSFSFSVTLGVGRFTVEKRLKLSESSLAQYAAEFEQWQLEQLTCPPLPLLQPASCDYSCASICDQQYSYIDANGEKQWLDGDGMITDQATAAALIAACVQNCKDEPGVPSECDVKRNLLLADLSPGGQYFENLPNRFIYDANGNLNNNGHYNPNGWLATIPAYVNNPTSFWSSFNTFIADPNNNCTNAAITVNSWGDVRTNWQPCFANFLLQYHPEYCQYDYFCNGVLCQYGGKSQTIGSSNGFDEVLMVTLDENQAILGNYFNPLGLTLNGAAPTPTTNTGNTTYQNFTDPGTPVDAYFGCDPLSGQCGGSSLALMENYLQKFYAIPNTSPQQYYSIWYVMEDPNNIHAGGQSVDAATEAFFKQLHGDPNASPATQGLLAPLNGTPQPGQITRWVFFRSVYLYYKRLIIYANFHNPTRDCNTLLADSDADGYTDIGTNPLLKGYQIRYPKNPIYDLYLANPTNLICLPNAPGPNTLVSSLQNFNNTAFTTSCSSACSSASQGWIDDIKATCTLNTQQEADIRNYLILVCQANCGGNYPEGSSGCSTCPGVQLAGNPAVVFHDFEDVISYFTSNTCTAVVTHPYNSDDADCSCSLMQNVIAANYPNQIPTTQQIATLFNSLYPRTTAYTASEITSWQAECAQSTPSQADLVNLNYPNGLMCFGPENITVDYSAGTCACGNINNLFGQLGLSTTNPAHYPAVAAAANALFNPAIPVTPTQVNQWVLECGQYQPVAANLFNANLPNALRCPVPADNSAQAINAAMAAAACNNNHVQLALISALSVYFDQREDALNAYLSYTRNNCLTNLIGRETFSETHSQMEFHYTLYYYDQAGNLVKTVPPDGVHPLDATQTVLVNTYRTNGTGSPVYPAHTLVTRYKFNSLQQMTESETPDGGLTYFWYDQLGRVILTQNARQRDYPQTDPSLGGEGYSYVLYDNLGRLTESGELIHAATTYTSLYQTGRNTTALTTWYTGVLLKRGISTPWYDDNSQTTTAVAAAFGTQGQTHLRNRISHAKYDPNLAVTGDEQLSYYSYDIHGNVHTLVNDNRLLSNIQQNLKRTTYKYDLVSGNVNEVWYQKDQHDQLGHRYRYDADNRLRQAFTSTDGLIWSKDVKYYCYNFGKLARIELGEKSVQGIDFAYVIFDLNKLKGINSTTLNSTLDIGRDGAPTGQNYNPQNRWFAQDASAFSLGYFSGDYKAVSGLNASTVSFTADETQTTNPYKTAIHDLYNGNISRMTSSQRDQNGNALEVLGRVFRYDQLNRIKKAEVFTDANLNANNYWSSAAANTNKWKEEFSFDGNGNIQTVKRYNASGVLMDNLSYSYATNKNQLVYVDDAASSAASADDIEDQSAGNYSYDKLGNLVADASEEIAKITWNTSGKITAITRIPGSNKPDLEFVYDASGQRIGKIVKPKHANSTLKAESEWVTTWYVKDVRGQLLAVYEQKFTTQSSTNYTLKYDLVERHLYGSSRIGLHNDQQASVDWTFNANIVNGMFANEGNWVAPVTPMPSTITRAARKLGNKLFELSNHLGNVLSTVSDRRKVVGTAGVVDYYLPEVITYNEYYVYGANLGSTRTYISMALKYRYGFNRKENDPESTDAGEGLQDYGFRIYNPSLGKFLSVDPLAPKFPFYSPYHFAGNKPTESVDLDGLEDSGFTMQLDRQYSTAEGASKANAAAKVNAPYTLPVAGAGVIIVFSPIWGPVFFGAAATVTTTATDFAIAASTPQGQMLIVETVGVIANALYPGMDDPLPTPGPGDELGKFLKYIFNANNVKVVELFTKGINIVASNAHLWGGNHVITLANKTTTVLGRFTGGVEFVKASGQFRYGENRGGINLLNVSQETYNAVIKKGGDELFWQQYNKPWLRDAINRGDNIRLVSDPYNPKNLFVNGVNGERTMFGREVEFLEANNYTFVDGYAVKKQ